MLPSPKPVILPLLFKNIKKNNNNNKIEIITCTIGIKTYVLHFHLIKQIHALINGNNETIIK